MNPHPIDQWLDDQDTADRRNLQQDPHGHCTLHGLPQPCAHCAPRPPRPKPAP